MRRRRFGFWLSTIYALWHGYSYLVVYSQQCTFPLDFGLETEEGEGDPIPAGIFRLVDEAVCALQELGGCC